MCSTKGRSKRLAVATILAAVLAACSAGLIAERPSARAESYALTSFAMEEGASVRLDDKKALRFTTKVLKSELEAVIVAEGEENVRVVTMIAYASAAEQAEMFEKGTVFTADVVFSAGNGNLYGVEAGENYEYRACLYDLEDKNVAKAFAARSYIEANGEVLAYTAFDAEKNARSAYEVAKAAIADDAYVVEGDEELTKKQLANLEYLSADFTLTVKADGYETQEIAVKRGESLAEHLTEYYEAIGANGTCEKIDEAFDEQVNAPVSENKTLEVEIAVQHSFADGVCSACGEFEHRIAEYIYTQNGTLAYLGFGVWGEDDGDAETINVSGGSITFKADFFKQALREGYTHAKFHVQAQRSDGQTIDNGILFNGGEGNYMKLYSYAEGGADVRVELTKFFADDVYKTATLQLVGGGDAEFVLSGFEFFKSAETVGWTKGGAVNAGYIYAAFENGKLVIDNNYAGTAAYVEIDSEYFAFQKEKSGSISMSYEVLSGGGDGARDFLLHFGNGKTVEINMRIRMSAYLTAHF